MCKLRGRWAFTCASTAINWRQLIAIVMFFPLGSQCGAGEVFETALLEAAERPTAATCTKREARGFIPVTLQRISGFRLIVLWRVFSDGHS